MTQFSLDMQVGISGDTLGEEEKVESHLSREKVKIRSIPLEGEVSIKGRPWGGAGWNGAGHEHLLRSRGPAGRWKKDAPSCWAPPAAVAVAVVAMTSDDRSFC